MGGAEKLLGKGDMLFYPVGAAKPRRVQGAFVSDQEVEELLDYIRAQGQEAETNEEIIQFTEQAMKEDGKEKESAGPQQDELLPEAVNAVLATGVASSSSIQRRFRIGYTRAARLIDTMEELHIVGPNAGSKPRDILMTTEQALAAVQKAME
jgi:S-DNA-T family DNA segregation ATPase FtsK/SpoIIIE